MGSNMIHIVCNGGSCQIIDRLPSIPLRMISGECSYQVAGFEHMQNRGRWDGFIRLFHKGRRTFPIGLLSVVRGVLDDATLPHVVTHAPSTLVEINLPEINTEFAIRDYQADAVEAAMQQQIAVIRMATGGGKTVVAGHLVSQIGLPTLFLVHTKDLLYQAIDAFSSMFGKENVGQIGDGVIEMSNITVATVQTMTRIFDLEYESYSYEDDDWKDDGTKVASGHAREIRQAMDGIGVVFMDECHRVAAPTAMNVMEQLTNPKFRIGLSASPWRDDGADLAIQACLGPVAYSITASELIDLGYLVRPIIRVIDTPPRSFNRGTSYATIYKEYIVENQERNDRIITAAASMVRRGKPTLVLVQRIRHGEMLQREISGRVGTWVPFLSGRDSAIARKSALDDIREGRSGIMIASVIADEGLDLKPLSGLILAGGGKSSVKALQRIGRTLRPFKDKEGAEIVDFNDQARYLMKHSEARQRLYDTEPAWVILDA